MRAGLCLLMGWCCLTAQATAGEVVPVQSVVISLIDDVAVASQDSGIVRKLLVREGDRVEAQAELGELDDIDAQLERQRMLAELQIARTAAASRLSVQLAEKAFGVANAELLRSEKSNEKYPDAVSTTELDKLRFARDQAELQIQHAREEMAQAELQVLLKQAEVDIANRRIERRRFRAPLAGLVVKVERQPGEWIQPGETLCRILRTDRLRAEGFVSLKDGVIRPGQPVQLRLQLEGAPLHVFSGVLSFVDPEVNPITGQYRVWAEIENPDEILRPGLRPEMLISPAPPATSAP
ncbi:efflux RND transporter periplasmic adaptor subunit [Planctomicrobium sp. SH664]|uniref:efflux RND transporter periplasmic adaptor subunit n=1 Tax=Planctomicrobium sp. SH664 TaxID=3448125 RepID=UPI003F5BE037